MVKQTTNAIQAGRRQIFMAFSPVHTRLRVQTALAANVDANITSGRDEMRYSNGGSEGLPVPSSALGVRCAAKLFENVEKLGKGNAYALGVANYSVTFGAERRHRERHGNAVISFWVDLGTV